MPTPQALMPTPYFSVPHSSRTASLPRPQTPSYKSCLLTNLPRKPLWRGGELGEADPTPNVFFLLPPDVEGKPDIWANASSLVEDMDSVAAICYTKATNVKWYVDYVQVSSNDRMTISPDLKTLVIHRVSRYDRTLHCAIESIPEILQRSEIISLTVNCEWSGATE